MELTQPQQSILRKLRQDTGGEDLSADPSRTFKAMDARYSFSSTRVALSALRKAYPACKEFESEMKKRTVDFRKMDDSQQASESMEAKAVDWDDLMAWRDAHWDDLSLEEQVLLGLYTMVAPQRVDYTPMRIVSRKPKTLGDETYLIVGSKSMRFLFHVYKTADRFGDRELKAPARLDRLLRAWMASRPDEPFLFGEGDKAWSEQRLGTAVRRIFQKHHGLDTGVSMLRHSYLTKKYAGMMPLKQLDKIQKEMGHGFLTSQKYRYINLE